MEVLPKKVKIAGKVFKIKYDKKTNGGTFDIDKMFISIGTKTPGRITEIMLHEILELIFEEKDLRYYIFKDKYSNDGLKFVFDHKEFESVVQELLNVLQQIDFREHKILECFEKETEYEKRTNEQSDKKKASNKKRKTKK